MFRRASPPRYRALLSLALVAQLGIVGMAFGHGGHGGHSSDSAPAAAARPTEYGGGSAKSLPPAPYGGQKVCPVSGEPLGSHGPAVPVETIASPASRPSFFQRVFQARPQSQKLTIYVCCAECAEQVKRDPGTYLARVIAQRGSSAPAGSAAGVIGAGLGAPTAAPVRPTAAHRSTWPGQGGER